MKSTITAAQEQSISELLQTVHLAKGVGTAESPCSVQAINLALSNRLTDEIPDCMSLVIGKWIIAVQDRMPKEIRDSQQWKRLLPAAAGTGRDREQERAALLLDWLYETALPLVQPVADRRGFGEKWQKMCDLRTIEAAAAAAARACSRASRTSSEAEWCAVAAAAAEAAEAEAEAEWCAVAAAEAALLRSRTAAEWAAGWQQLDPCGLLQRLIELPQ